MHVARLARPRHRLTVPLRRAVAAVAAGAAALAMALLGATPAAAAGFSVTGNPTVPGAAYVGQAISVSLAGMSITPTPATVTVNWHWSDGTQLADGNANDLIYTPTSADVGKSLYAAVYLAGSSGEAYVAGTNLTGAVALPGFSTVPTLAVTGTGVVGDTLTLSTTAGSWTPSPDSLTYTWHRYPVDAVVQTGTGAAFTTYTPTSADIGSTLYVVVTASRADTVDNTQTSTASTTVHAGSFASVGRPTVSGTGVLGTPFTASFDTTGVTPAPTSVTYQWYLTNGTPISGATSAIFTPTLALVGQPVYVAATLHTTGYQDYLTLGSDYSRTVSLRSFTPGATPVVVGQHVLTGSLTAQLDTAAWSPQPTSLTYQWYLSDGTAIAGATAATLLPTQSLVGSSVYAVVTAHASGYQPYVIATAPSGTIASPTLAASTSKAVVGDKVTVELWGLLFNTDYALELHSTPVALSTVRSDSQGVVRATVTLPAGTPNGTHHIVVLLNGVEVASVPITVAAPTATTAAPAATATPTTAKALAATGAGDARGLLLVAAVLSALGVAGVLAAGRRSSARI